MLYLIKKGNHYPTPKQISLHSGISFLNKTVTFYDNCIHHLGHQDDNDVNKLYGFTTDLFGSNSVRIGWNIMSANTGVQAIKLWAYVHIDGKRVIPTIPSDHIISKFFKTNIPITCAISVTNGNAYFTAKQGTEGRTVVVPFPKTPGIGYYQFPYFGGTSTCPHYMNIDIS